MDMSEFGDLANLDVERLLRISEDYSAKVQEVQERSADLKGHAESKDRRIKVTCTVTGGLTDIDIDPRAMRMPAAAFAETLKTLIHDANADLQSQLSELMTEIYGADGNPLAFEQNQKAAKERIDAAKTMFDRTLGDAMSELERISKQLGL
jgi:DNA-binding protein YbaB